MCTYNGTMESKESAAQDVTDNITDATSSDNPANTSQETVVYIMYKRRWWMLAVLCFLNLTNALVWFSFAPIATITEEYYGVSRQAVNWLSQIFMLIYIPTTFAATWALDAHSLYLACCIGAALNVAGVVIRVISLAFAPTDSGAYAMLMLGQCFAGAAQPFILSATTKLAAAWFSDSTRATANTIGAVANPLGIAVASAVTPIIVSEDNPSSVDTMLWIYAVVCVVLALPVLTLQSHPPTPPSASASTYKETNADFIKGLKVISRSYAYLMLVLIFGIGLGLFNSLTTLLEQILSPNGYSVDDAGLAGALIILGGLFGAGLAGPILDKTKRYIEVLRVCVFGALMGFVWFAAVANTPGNLTQILICSAILGFFAFGFLPTSLELGAECTYPVNEGTSSGFLYMSGQVFGLVFISIMDGPLTTGDDKDMSGATWFMVGVGCVCFIGSLAWRGKYKRHEAELAITGNPTESTTGNKLEEESVTIDGEQGDTGIDTKFNPTSTDAINASVKAQENNGAAKSATHQLYDEDDDAFSVSSPTGSPNVSQIETHNPNSDVEATVAPLQSGFSKTPLIHGVDSTTNSAPQ